ncbi:MAG: ADP-forming succinate--CoA ligase subunit beta [Candidatus Zixiibacteriota bacterium]
MKIHEYQAKEILRNYGIPIQVHRLCTTADECVAAFRDFDGMSVIKAQVLTGGRGKAGGVKLAKTVEEARDAAEAILGMDIKGLKVEKILTCKAVDIEKEFYFGFVNDRNTKSITLMASAEGGVEIEEVAKTAPEKIIKIPIDIEFGLLEFQARNIALELMGDMKYAKQAAPIFKALYKAYVENDCTLAEINPLVITDNGKVLALDAKINFDDNALYRHSQFEKLRDPTPDERTELLAKSKGLSFIKLDGNIGCMVNGAGLAMATMDMIKLYGGEPANFLDIGGSSNPQKVIDAMDILLKDDNVKVVMINIFGGITRCDDVAKGLLKAMDEINVDVPVVARLTGTNSKDGRKMLEGTKLIPAGSMAEAAEKAISLIGN